MLLTISSQKQLSLTILIFQVVRKICEEEYRMPKLCKQDDKKLYCIMLKCWADDVDERPTFETLTWQFKDFFQDHNYKRTVFRARSINFYKQKWIREVTKGCVIGCFNI